MNNIIFLINNECGQASPCQMQWKTVFQYNGHDELAVSEINLMGQEQHYF